MYSVLKQILFLFEPELAHKIAMVGLRYALKVPIIRNMFQFQHIHEFNFSGIKFKNRLGIAAGFDKNAEYIHELDAIGFGYIEIGTVTPLAQSGNPKPRLFRLKQDEALMNRMGFNNKGADAVVENLKKYVGKGIIIGGNIGKNKNTPNERADEDYRICFEKLYPYVDYFVVNVSSPNTPNLRELQEKDTLVKIFNSLQSYRKLQLIFKPIFLKIAPDLNHDQLDVILDVYDEFKIDALIVSNTTIDYEVLSKDKEFAYFQKTGGISGRPIVKKSNEVISYLKSKNSNIQMIGVGGIDDAPSAKEKFDLGCSLIQVYTGFIYKGTSLIKEILK